MRAALGVFQQPALEWIQVRTARRCTAQQIAQLEQQAVVVLTPVQLDEVVANVNGGATRVASRPVNIRIQLGARALRAVVVTVGLSCAACATAPMPFRATQVSPGILVGRQPRGQADYETLRGHGVRTILCLRVLPWDVDYGRRHAETLGITFRSVPVPASPLKPSERRIKEALLTLRDQTLRPIFMHCNLGRDRSALIVGLYRIYYEDWTPEAAWAEMLRTGFKVRWSLRGLRAYFWSHSQKPEWVSQVPAR
jgi:protein tyrosine phosphatase (PTP) superfamily phosphohydrolase (DUF442 family)